MTDQAAFLRAIVEYPHDLLPRLVFADWLDENVTETNGFAERAEFIRLQCEIESKPDADAEGREGVLFRANAARWWPGLPNVTVNPDWFAGPNGMRTDEPSFLVRNGLVEETRCRLMWWVGGRCPCGVRHAAMGRYGIPRYDPNCTTCHGTGHVPANGPAVVTKHPVTRVVVTAGVRVDEAFGGPHPGWFAIRTDIRDLEFPKIHSHPTREAAVEAMSRALVSWAREQAGLTPIQWTDIPSKESA